MRQSVDLESFLPDADWQRLETWAALAGMAPMDYLRVCVHRGHAILRQELQNQDTLNIRPGVDVETPVSNS
jgi:hypothetical protein